MPTGADEKAADRAQAEHVLADPVTALRNPAIRNAFARYWRNEVTAVLAKFSDSAK